MINYPGIPDGSTIVRNSAKWSVSLHGKFVPPLHPVAPQIDVNLLSH
jgi:hypothetical protein